MCSGLVGFRSHGLVGFLALVGLRVSRSHGRISLFCFNQEMKLFIKFKNVFFAKTRDFKK